MLVETILGKEEDFLRADRKLEKIYLTHFELQKPHQKVKTEDGLEMAISLGHGENLFKGAVLYEDTSLLIVVDLAEEDVLEIRPHGNFMWGRVGFNIGNMHHPAYLTDESILCPYDPIIERLVKNMGVDYVRTVKKIDGVRANCQVGSQTHSHSHGHSHNHSHSQNHDHTPPHGHDHEE